MDEGVRVVWIANLDNLGAAIDPLVLGKHLDGGAPLTVEVVEKVPGDRGGSPFRVDGRPVILESFRVPEDVDEDSVGSSTRTRSWWTPQSCATWTWRGRGSGSRSRSTGGRRSSSSA